MPMMLEAIRAVRRAVGDRLAIRSPGTGPFALASYLIGTQQWLLEVGMVEAGMDDGNEAAIHHALELAAEALIRFGKACWDAGADILHCGDSLASCDVISPHTYRRFAFPYQQKVFRAWKEYGITASLLHICGDSTKVLELYADTGADLIEIDNKVDLGYARQTLGRRVALMGNVHTVTELLQGSRELVRGAARRCIRRAGETGFLLGSGCLVPRGTPVENVRELVRVAHQHRCGGSHTTIMPDSATFHPPRVDPSVFIAAGARIIGDVTIGAESSVWFNAVIRADGEPIRIGRQTNIQDLCMLHTDIGIPCVLGDRVTLGHGVIVHGAVVEDDVLIGMGAVVMNRARIGSGSIIAGGSVVTEGAEVPPGSIVMGVPARVKRRAEASDRERIRFAAEEYVRLARRYAGARQ
jgi:carbonic anhydrase/acetyltransferase-like protein (isoleucine patch superfamily)